MPIAQVERVEARAIYNNTTGNLSFTVSASVGESIIVGIMSAEGGPTQDVVSVACTSEANLTLAIGPVRTTALSDTAVWFYYLPAVTVPGVKTITVTVANTSKCTVAAWLISGADSLDMIDDAQGDITTDVDNPTLNLTSTGLERAGFGLMGSNRSINSVDLPFTLWNITNYTWQSAACDGYDVGSGAIAMRWVRSGVTSAMAGILVKPATGAPPGPAVSLLRRRGR